ncbi:MAG TPA: hypothetical protein ENI23_07100 [bacterium]|nr:hypothetical protein [bacterium]
MKSKINLRLCVAGSESLLKYFEECLDSYLEHFQIEKLLVYTTDNLSRSVDYILEDRMENIDDIAVYDVDKFYKEYKDKFSKNVIEVLEHSRNIRFKKRHSSFYLRMRLVMDSYLAKGPIILSDIDIRIHDNIEPIVDWVDSDYVLYNSDPMEESYLHTPVIINKVGGGDFFKPIPWFNDGWMCFPKGVMMDVDEIFSLLKLDMGNCPAEMACIAAFLIRHDIKTKLLPMKMMVQIGESQDGKTLSHLGPYGLE